jgi:hypothetical protein
MTWLEKAKCAGHGEPLWDGFVDGESAKQRAMRHERGKAVCRRCPVAMECLLAVDTRFDDGIRGGHLLPDLKSPKVTEREIVHGTEAGAKAHYRRGDTPCDPCKRAMALARRERQERATA